MPPTTSPHQGHSSIRFFRASASLLLLAAGPFLQAQVTSTPSQPTVPSGSAPPGGQPVPDASKLPAYDEAHPLTTKPPASAVESAGTDLTAWRGLRVSDISFKGVPPDRLQPLQSELALQPGQALQPENIRSSLRRLYATGLYANIEVDGIRTNDEVQIIFDGTPQLFIGRVNVDGVSSENFTSLLVGATKLSPGTPYTQAKLDRGLRLIKNLLVTNGYYQATALEGHSVDPRNQQMNVNYVVTLGQQARVGEIKVNGNSGLAPDKFRKTAKLKRNTRVTRDTVNTALDKLRAHYQKQQQLESKVALADKTYVQPTNHLNYSFDVAQSNKVVVVVNGVKISQGSIRNLIPVYQEGTVDEDLLNEGNRRVRDLYQRKGYFDIQVAHTLQQQPNGGALITYNVQLGKVHDVDSVAVSGNKYIATDLITPRLNVHPNGIFDPRGTYSVALVASDVATIKAIYQGNGFEKVDVKPVVKDSEDDPRGKPSKIAHITVDYVITEGTQSRFGSYKLVGNLKVPSDKLLPLLNTQVGQPYNSTNLTGDRDAILTYYLANGYDQSQVDIKQVPNPEDPNLVDATLEITEGDQIHVNNVLVSGLHYTRNQTVADKIKVHPGDVLNQTALIDTQRQLYDLTLFNGVNTAVQNPNGEQLRKDVLLQFTEAKRWDVSYGFGFQFQTGTPTQNNVLQNIQNGLPPYANANGITGASVLVSLNVSRINLRGSDNSLSLRTTYGTLEQIALLTFNDPSPFGKKNLTLSADGGYDNERSISTYSAARTLANLRLTQRVGRPPPGIDQYQFRRVAGAAAARHVAPRELPRGSQPVRISGPGVTYIRDTRRPSSLDAAGGTNNTVSEFYSDNRLGSQANFNRLDGTNSTYYPFGTVHKYVLARQTRVAYERAFGTGFQELIPLPERIYGGGAQSHRGFAINAAGPHDNITGYPIGGAAAFINNLELRLPPPTLPVVGSSVSFVTFLDSGNVFLKGSDIWPSAIRFRQPNRAGCRDLNAADQQAPAPERNSLGFTGQCSYNYFSHALGLGARYATPIGPIRVDASYNLNPPIYPQIQGFNLGNVNAPPNVGQAGHFNFFFSIGQAF